LDTVVAAAVVSAAAVVTAAVVVVVVVVVVVAYNRVFRSWWRWDISGPERPITLMRVEGDSLRSG